MSLNIAAIQGRLTRDIELKQTNGGQAVCNFSVAHNRRFAGKDETSFFDCVAFGTTAEFLAKYFGKGKEIIVNGRLQQHIWEKDGQKRTTIEIIANEVNFAGSATKTSEDNNGEEERAY